MKTPKSAPSTAASQSASAKKMLGDLPPSSRVTRFRVSAALFTIIFPTAALPVKATLSTPGWATRAAPVILPKPLMMFTTPGGRPASSNQLANSKAVSGVCSAGFRMQVQPAASAGACRQAAVIFEASGHVGDIVLGFDDWLAGVARFEIGQTGSVLADFIGQLEEDAAAILRRSF